MCLKTKVVLSPRKYFIKSFYEWESKVDKSGMGDRCGGVERV